MKNSAKVFLLFFTFFLFTANSFGQCVDTNNIYTFVHNGHTYEVVKENKTWTAASTCAVERGGYLAEIADVAEQDAIFDELSNNAGINIASTQNQFGTASVWLGGSDAGTEGEWIWDGNNDGVGAQFWSGGPSGTVVGGSYTNWGVSPAEPDNSGGQDYLTMIIKPTATNFSLWNDLISTNTIYSLIEIDGVLGIENLDLKNALRIYPNPIKDFVSIENNSNLTIETIEIMTLSGQVVQSILGADMSNKEINVSDLEEGIYLFVTRFENGETTSHKIVK